MTKPSKRTELCQRCNKNPVRNTRGKTKYCIDCADLIISDMYIVRYLKKKNKSVNFELKKLADE